MGGLFHLEVPFGHIDLDRVTFAEFAFEHRQRELVNQPLLDHALQRPGAVGRVVAEVRQ